MADSPAEKFWCSYEKMKKEISNFFPGWRGQPNLDRRPDELPSERRVDPHAAAEARPEGQVLPMLPGFAVSGDLHHAADPAENTILHVS